MPLSARVHPHCLPTKSLQVVRVMRCSATPAVVVGLSWFAKKTDAFVIGPPRGSSSSNERTCTGCPRQHQLLSTAVAVAKQSLAIGTTQLEARWDRKSRVAMSASSQDNGAKWGSTPKAMVRSSFVYLTPDIYLVEHNTNHLVLKHEHSTRSSYYT